MYTYIPHCVLLVSFCSEKSIFYENTVFLGFPERTGEEDQQRAGPETLGARAHRGQPRRLLLGQGPDAGTEHTLGDRVCTVHIQADPLGSSPAAGDSLVNCSWG